MLRATYRYDEATGEIVEVVPTEEERAEAERTQELARTEQLYTGLYL